MDTYRTQTISIRPGGRDYREWIGRAGEFLRRGCLVAFPTETVYGLAANAERPAVLARLREVKGRPEGKPFTYIIHEREEVSRRLRRIPAAARALMAAFWPGPLTLVLEDGTGATVGFRMPDHRVALDLIAAAGVRLVAPSANASGSSEPHTAGDVQRELGGKIELILDGGPTQGGVPSTVVRVTEGMCEVLRAGAIDETRIREAIRETR